MLKMLPEGDLRIGKIAPGHLFMLCSIVVGGENGLLFGTPLTMAYNYPFGSDETDKTHHERKNNATHFFHNIFPLQYKV